MQDHVVLCDVDERHTMHWQVNTMPRGVNDRDFLSLATRDEERLSFVSKSLVERHSAEIEKDGVSMISQGAEGRYNVTMPLVELCGISCAK